MICCTIYLTIPVSHNCSSKMILWRYWAVILFLVDAMRANPIVTRPVVATEFIILHNNDMHGRFEQTNVNSETCPPEDVKNEKCFGGFARVAYE